MLRQISESEFSGPELTEGACIFRTPWTLEAGRPVEWMCYDDDGLGPARRAIFEAEDGTVFMLEHHEMSPRKDLTVVFVRPGDMAGGVDAVMEALELTSGDLGWLRPGVRLRATRLIRQDDNGVRFHTGDYACRADAAAVVRRLTAGAHKQTFFLESMAEGVGPTLRFPEDFTGPPVIVPGTRGGPGGK